MQVRRCKRVVCKEVELVCSWEQIAVIGKKTFRGKVEGWMGGENIIRIQRKIRMLKVDDARAAQKVRLEDLHAHYLQVQIPLTRDEVEVYVKKFWNDKRVRKAYLKGKEINRGREVMIEWEQIQLLRVMQYQKIGGLV